MENEFYQLKAHKSNGETISMQDFEGQTILIVNTATKCGLAPQFEGLEKLHQNYKDAGLLILGFPCDQFAGQEPETDETMAATCLVNHGVTFELLQKCDVNGPNTQPIFKYLKKELPGFLGGRIKWNFTKFLIDRNGKPVKRYAPTTKPEAIEDDIQKLL